MTLQIGMAACVFRSVEMLSVARHCGFDFLVADMEHGAFSLGEAATLCVAGLEAGYPVHVRVPSAGSENLTRAADCGARGLIVPHVDSAEEAAFVADRLRFPPRGRRSIPSPLAVAGFRPLRPDALIALCETNLSVTVMIESAEGVAAARAIAAIEGIDTLMVGANDLAQSLGHTGDVAHEEVRAAFQAVAEAARAAGRAFGVIGVPSALLRSHALALGARVAIVANDIDLIVAAGVGTADAIRRLAGGGDA